MAKKDPSPIDRHVGALVRRRRLLLGMSQEKLGDAIGLTFQQVQKYEKGANRIGASRLVQIAGALQVPAAFFFADAPGAGANVNAAPADPLAALGTTRDGLALAVAFNAIPDPHQRAAILAVAEACAAPAPSKKARAA